MWVGCCAVSRWRELGRGTSRAPARWRLSRRGGRRCGRRWPVSRMPCPAWKGRRRWTGSMAFLRLFGARRPAIPRDLSRSAFDWLRVPRPFRALLLIGAGLRASGRGETGHGEHRPSPPPAPPPTWVSYYWSVDSRYGWAFVAWILGERLVAMRGKSPSCRRVVWSRAMLLETSRGGYVG